MKAKKSDRGNPFLEPDFEESFASTCQLINRKTL